MLAELTKPGPIYFSIDQWGDDMSRFKVRANFQATAARDNVVSREVTLTIADGQPTVTTIPGNVNQYDFFGNDNQMAKLSLVDIDQAGNRSEPREGSALITDTIPPNQPGPFVFQTMEQVDDEEPTPPA